TTGMSARAMDVPFGANQYPVTVLERELPSGVRAVLLDAPDLFDRDGLYGDASGDYKDNAFRFAVLCRGALEFARVTGLRPSVIHAHDWQGGLAPVYARTELADDPVIGGVRTVFTIHNLAFQGLFDSMELQWINLDRGIYHPGALEYWGQASALKGGVVFSDVVTTVSPTYAREILGAQFGFNFQGILQNRATNLVGILNGIDTKVWDPAADPHLPRPYDATDLSGKRDAKRALLETLNMPADDAALDRAVVGLVSRLTYQKGFDLVLEAGDRLLGPPVTYVMLGSGDRHYEDFWTSLAARFPDRVATRLGFDDHLAHLIEAGADMFLMPSWFEPCGLNQMYSLRYGTLPIVRATGGLEDTVHDADADQAGGNGFKFYEFTADAMLNAIHRAAWGFGERERWAAIQRRGMAEDHSWDVSAREYVKVFEG
ncbi:MAG TPA: glycogen/starch synthase, partial [Vicinamibacterales bacterium]|nr:glycogen/starch synthase [Vicinamibacterales bacterium]